MKLFTYIIFFIQLGSFGFSEEKYPEIWDKLINHNEWEHVKKTEKYNSESIKNYIQRLSRSNSSR